MKLRRPVNIVYAFSGGTRKTGVYIASQRDPISLGDAPGAFDPYAGVRLSKCTLHNGYSYEVWLSKERRGFVR